MVEAVEYSGADWDPEFAAILHAPVSLPSVTKRAVVQSHFP